MTSGFEERIIVSKKIHIDILPLSSTVRLWRKARGLTQAALARRVRMPRPNLSAIEQGRRDVSVRTLRALAAGLGVRPGLLVDGVAPSLQEGRRASHRWTRARLERIAAAVVQGRVMPDPQERQLVEALRQLVRHRSAALSRTGRSLGQGKRAAAESWLWLESHYPRPIVNSLLQRISDRQQISSI